jgi:hypothetical protein
MFLKDQSGNTYFTTCSHVTRKNEIARGEGGLELGQSVFDIDTATDMTYSDLIDLSIVKVKDDIASQCQFGLRTAAGHYQGEVILLLQSKVVIRYLLHQIPSVTR